jgi:hypothetical protein
MKSYEIVGYIYDDETICKHCFDKLQAEQIEKLKQQGYTKEEIQDELLDIESDYFAKPIFAGDEWEQKPSCCNCLDEIDVTVCK